MSTPNTDPRNIELNAYNNYLTRKLEHYNKWLMDLKRPLTEKYPGFPEDFPPKTVKSPAKTVTNTPKPAKPERKTKEKKVRPARSGEGPTKQELANAIFTRLRGEKASVIAAIQEELGMSSAGATTYFYNAKKVAR